MPSLTSLPLSLSEILEAQGGPLRELEIWALLCQCAESLQDIIIKGEPVEEAFRHMITPNSLLVRDNGTVVLGEVNQNLHGSLYMAPELEHTTRQLLSDTAFEKMFVYSLGRTLQVASEFGLKESEVLSISYDLDSLLQAMSERNAAVRLSLMHILEACALQASQHPNKPPHTYTLSRLYKSVLSSNSKRPLHDTSFDSSRSSVHTMTVRPGRARKPRPHVRHRHDNQRTWSRSRSRSRSRSQSRERGDRDSGILTASYQGSIPPQKLGDQREPSINDDAESKVMNAPASSSHHLLNTSMTSTGSELSEFHPRPFQAPAYSAAHSVQGLLGLRQGSPAYQKYIQLKERQIRLRQARTGKQASVLNDVRSRLMTPTLMSYENMTETHSMASLMSYTLGTYKPGLQSTLGSNAALNYSKETDSGSQMSLFLNSGDFSDTLRAEELPVAVLSFDPTWLNLERPTQQVGGQQAGGQQMVHDMQQEQSSRPVLQKQQQLSSEAADSQEPKTKSTPAAVAKPKEYYGPEFIHNDKKPAIRIAMPLQGDSVKNAALARRVIIVHLTGQKLEVILDPSTTGRQLFDTVIPCLDLDDFFFFGLTYICEGEHFFLDGDIKLHKVAPEGWKEGPKNHSPPVNFTLYVRVKFYPESLTDFRHTSSYHLLYLQLRRDVIEERVTYNSDTLSRLAGLALQVEYGDYSQADMGQGYFLADHYVSFKAIRRFGGAYVETNAIREHKNCKGIAESQAEIEYIKHVRHLPEYGIHFHRLFKNKSNTDSFMWIGLSQHCLVLAEQEVLGRRILKDYPWNAILKISFNKRRFSIQPKVEGVKGKPPKINFYTNSYRKGRYLLQFSTDQHRFQIRMRTRPSNMETLAGDLSVEFVPQTAEAGVGDDVIGEDGDDKVIPPPPYVDPSLQALPDDDDDDDFEGDWGRQPMAHLEHPLQYRSPPPYQPPNMALILGGSHVFPELNPLQLHASMNDLTSGALNEHQLMQLLDLSSESPSLDSALASEKTDYEEVSPPYPKQEFFKSESQIGRLIFEVMLEKEGKHGIGITIVGGETTNSLDLGIFVKSIVPGGPAERDGRIMPGDRLIAIGGVSLEGKQHHEAVELIRDGGPRITLLVSQIRPPGTIKKRSPQEEHADFRKKLTTSLIEYRSNKNGHNSIYEKDFFDSGANDFLQFDDFVNKARSRSSSFSDQVCHSDEENYDLEPPGFGQRSLTSTLHTLPAYRPHPAYISKLSSAFHHTKTSPHDLADDPDIEILGADHTDFDEWEAILDNQIDKVSKQSLSKDQIEAMSAHFDNDKVNTQGDDTVLKLPGNEELSYKLDFLSNDWSPEGAPTTQADFYHGQLTKEEEDALQMLGDIAALDDNDSTSDSDFDTAVKKTIEGPLNKTFVSTKTNNVANPEVGRGQAEKPSSEMQKASNVIYEVILERSDLGFGIVTCDITSSDADNAMDGVYIKNILSGSCAEKGGILAPGDKILEIAGKNVEGHNSVQVNDLMNAAPDLTTIKVLRPAHRDTVLTGKNNMTDNNQNVLNVQFPFLGLHNTLSEQKNNHLQSDQIIEISLRKKPDAGFGFTVAGGVNTGGCYVKQLVSDPAVSDGRLRPGDKILKVNGRDTTTMSHVEAVTLLRKVHDVANLQLLRYPSSMEIQERLNSSKIPFTQQQPPLKEPAHPAPNRTKQPSLKDVQQSVRDLVKSMDTPKAIIKPYDYRGRTPDVIESSNAGSQSESHTAQLDEGHQELRVMTIELFKPDNSPTSLGMSVIERTYRGERGIYVKRLKVGGTADKDGRLQAGDRILQVNDIPFDGVHQRKAVTILREAGQRVVFKIIRSSAADIDEKFDGYDDENATDDDISSLAEDALSLMERKKELDHAHRTQTNGAQERKDSDPGGRYMSPRTFDLDVPVLLTDDWLNDVPVMHMPQNKTKDYVGQLLQSLADLVEGGEPHEEFKNLHHLKEAGPCNVGKLPQNKSKNRYRNVLPYDQSRVVLLNSSNDYINASHISVKVGDNTLKYIACQGPVSESVSDFWLMMWQEKTNVIAMLTQTTESGKIKCHCYWPQSKEEVLGVDNGRLRVQQIRSYQLQALEIVQMIIEEVCTGAGREITLLQYTAWPDHGIPDTALPLLKLLQLIHLFERGSAPVIHCSAGIGRTGTLIAIDVSLATIEHGDEFDLLDIVRNLRNQRHGMIQTTDQYLFCYTACMEALLSLEEDTSQ